MAVEQASEAAKAAVAQEQGATEARTPETLTEATLTEGRKAIEAAETAKEYKYFSASDIKKLREHGISQVRYRPQEGGKKEATVLVFQPNAEVHYKLGVKPGEKESKKWNKYAENEAAITHDSTSVEVTYTSYGVTLITINNPDGKQDLLKIGYEKK